MAEFIGASGTSLDPSAEGWVEVRGEAIARANQMTQLAMIRSMYQILVSVLTGKIPNFHQHPSGATQSYEPLPIAGDFAHVWQEAWVPFMESYIKEMLVMGVAVAKIKTMKYEDRVYQVPKILNSLSFLTGHQRVSLNGKYQRLQYKKFYVRMLPDTGDAEYAVFKRDSITGHTTRDTRCIFLTGLTTSAPNIFGELQSVMASLFDVQEEYDDFVLSARAVERTLVSPTVFYTAPPTGASSTLAESTQTIIEPEDGILVEAQGIEAVNFVTQRSVERAIQSQAKRRDEHVPRTVGDNYITLPVGMQPVIPYIPSRPGHGQEVLDKYRQSVSAALGIPLPLIIQDRAFHVSGAADLVQNQFNNTIRRWSMTLSQQLTDMFNEIYYDFNRVQVLKRVELDGVMTANQILEGVAPAAAIQISISPSLSLPPKTATFLYSIGGLTALEYINAVRSSVNLPEVEDASTLQSLEVDKVLELATSLLQ